MKVVESRILVQVDKEALKTKIGSFEISENPLDYESATVLEVGPKAEGVNPGDKVYIYKGAGKDFKHEGKEYRVITINEIIVIL